MTDLTLVSFKGWRGAVIILAGILLNMAVCGALFKDLEWTLEQVRETTRSK